MRDASDGMRAASEQAIGDTAKRTRRCYVESIVSENYQKKAGVLDRTPAMSIRHG
jgi:hypothetical protein